uniref:Uncharacterized protein n=1 Tax=Chromera velia CCMP2878 TaxID=1169474 RepID=A0A0G4GQH5_9ALVE|eukprot:Cvel_22928.t1-p1 / transcript=Cvel_22928.t1 / gene=Cvel_22928 / organism=Chromera_velia_CCMP2878 / gene_product=hypothetical protein / transcript_product=hypothetical protein / location=Cvel_scaffold2306:8757-10844(+) / protein_length=370 / sequence_SO=supercontig / SO=protein_coding / is_pseudo=false
MQGPPIKIGSSSETDEPGVMCPPVSQEVPSVARGARSKTCSLLSKTQGSNSSLPEGEGSFETISRIEGATGTSGLERTEAAFDPLLLDHLLLSGQAGAPLPGQPLPQVPSAESVSDTLDPAALPFAPSTQSQHQRAQSWDGHFTEHNSDVSIDVPPPTCCSEPWLPSLSQWWAEELHSDKQHPIPGKQFDSPPDYDNEGASQEAVEGLPPFDPQEGAGPGQPILSSDDKKVSVTLPERHCVSAPATPAGLLASTRTAPAPPAAPAPSPLFLPSLSVNPAEDFALWAKPLLENAQQDASPDKLGLESTLNLTSQSESSPVTAEGSPFGDSPFESRAASMLPTAPSSGEPSAACSAEPSRAASPTPDQHFLS